MAETLRVNITGDSSDLTRALLKAVASLETASALMTRHNSRIATDTEKTAKRVKNAWYDAETGLIDFKRSSEVLASAISTTRGGPINSLTRGLGNVVMWSGRFADSMQRALAKILPAANAGEKAAGIFGDLGVTMGNLVPIVGALLGVLSTLSIALLALPAVVGGVVFAFTALLEAATVLGAGLLALSAPVTVVVGLLGGLAVAFGIVTAASIKNKATQQDVHDNLLKLHVAQQTYNQDVTKYGKTATQTENALLALHKAQDAYELSQLGVALSTAKIQDKFHSLIATLSGRFAPTIKSLVVDAGQALTYLNKVAKLPLGQAFKSLSTTGVRGVTDFIQKVGFMLAKPFRLAIKFGFGVGGDTLSSQAKALWAELSNFLTGPHGALNPVVSWFHRQDFTETGLRWAHEIIHGLVGLWNRDKAFSNSVKTILSDAGHVAGHAFATTLKWEISQIFGWLKSSGVGGFALFGAAIVVALSPVITAFRNIGLAAKAVWFALGRVVTMLTEVSLGMDVTAASSAAAAAGLDAEAVSATAAAVATEAEGAAAVSSTTSTLALSYAAIDASVALDGAAVSATAAGVASEEAAAGGIAGMVAGLGELAGPIALVAALTAGLVLLEKSQPTPNTRIRVGEAAGQILTGASRPTNTTALKNIRASTEDVITGFNEARAAADRLYDAIHRLSGAKMTLKGDKITLGLDKVAVQEAHNALEKALNDPHSTPLEIKALRLDLRQAKFNLDAQKKITIPFDKQQVAKERAAVQAELNKMVGGFKHAFAQISHNNLGNLANTLAQFHGHAIKAATGIEAFANRIRKSDPIAAKFKDHEAAMALATDDLTQKIGHVPTVHQVNIYLKHNLDSITRQVQLLGASIDHLTSKALSVTTTFRTYHYNYGPASTAKSTGNNAKGTSNWRGGMTWVGEEGPEIIDLPAGSKVYSASKSALMASGMAGGADRYGAPGGAPAPESNALTGAALNKKIHDRFNSVWNYIGDRFFPGRNKPSVKLVAHAIYLNGVREAGITAPGSIPRHITFDTTSTVGALGRKAARYADFKDMAIQLMLHEMAHSYQKPNQRWRLEGGAEAFSWRTLTQVLNTLGIGNSGAIRAGTASLYPGFLKRVRQQQSPEWQLFGQFAQLQPVSAAKKAAYVNQYKFHGYGGNAWPGQISVVGENGPELRHELTPARYTPATDTKRAMGGGETHLHFHFPNAVIVDKKSIEQAARLVKPPLDRMAGRR